LLEQEHDSGSVEERERVSPVCASPTVETAVASKPYSTRAERAAFVDGRLAELYPNPAVPLLHDDPYTLLIAVLLSAQCTDARVNEVTPRLFAVAETPEAMAKLPVERIQEIVRPCGLAPQKARAIAGLSKILLE